MCGICGFAGGTRTPADAQLLQRMNSALTHRGPDDEGSFLDPGCALAMRRLSIIDLHTGKQPISNDGTWIVYNGETYNYRSLRVGLEKAGFAFSTRSDTEVVLNLYKHRGLEFLHELRGMFALALWDESAQRLVLARDPVGVKPLFYTVQGDRLYFASEIKALLEAEVPRRLDEHSLYHYLTFLYVPPPRTMFAGIRQLPPGHVLVWEKGIVRVEEYWVGPSAHLRSTAPSRPSELWDQLLNSVQAHLESDVPIGVFLSGGLDSSALALAVKELGYPLQTFTIAFPGAGLYDESKHARHIASVLGSDHHEEAVRSDIVEELPAVLRALDEPMADASVMPNYHLARLAARHVKVALSGAGGDELLGGYRRYAADGPARVLRLITPRFLRSGVIEPLLERLPSGDENRFSSLVRLARKLFADLDSGPAQRYLAWNSSFGEAEKLRLLTRILFSYEPGHELLAPHFERSRHREFPDQAMHVDLKTYLPGDPLMLSDRLTMAHSLEARVPFVDVPFMEYAAALPSRDKVRGWQTKVAFREALMRRLPETIVKRPKQGFGTPIDLWLRKELLPLARKLLSPEAVAARGLFRPGYVDELLQRHLAGQDYSQHLWPLLMVELWHRMYIDRKVTQLAQVV